MISVYRIKSDVNHYQYFLTEQGEDEPKLMMDCTPKAEAWSPTPVFIYMPKLGKGDFYNFTSSALITSPRATEVLHTHLVKAGELLPLPYNGEVYTVLNVTECINCLDHEKTEWVYGKSTGAKIGIKRYTFHRNRFSESDIFKIPETCKSEILVVEGIKDVKDSFKYAVESAGLEGLIFEEVWEV